jgi:hypothetical protein
MPFGARCSEAKLSSTSDRGIATGNLCFCLDLTAAKGERPSHGRSLALDTGRAPASPPRYDQPLESATGDDGMGRRPTIVAGGTLLGGIAGG